MTAIETIAGELTSFRSRELTGAAAAAGKRVIIDWVAVTCGGADGVVAGSLAASLSGQDGPCRLLGSGGRTLAPLAALINGTAAHTLELDDIYAPGTFHPGAPVIAAAFAVAEMAHASGRDFLRAVIAGYEVGDRVAADLGPAHYRAFHTTGTAGALGAAAASGLLLGLDEERMAHAMAISATLAAGLQQTFRSDAVAKPLHAGNAAQAGVIAALAAQGGATGALDILDGDLGMGNVMADGTIWTRSSQSWSDQALVEQTTMKAYPCCGHAFAAIDAAGLLRGSIRSVDEIEAVVVETYAVAIATAGIRQPVTAAEAKFSIPFTVATMLLAGKVDLESFGPAQVSDARTRALLGLVRMEESAQFSAAFPARRGASATIHMRDGQRHHVAVPDRFGSPENPVSDELLEQKFVDLLRRSDSTADPEHLMRGLLSIEDLDDICLLQV